MKKAKRAKRAKGNKKTKTVKIKMKKMPKPELKKYKALLLKVREDISSQLSHITEDTLKKSQRDAAGDLSGYSFHMADMASDDYEREFSLGRATEEQKMLYLIDETLRRMEEGTYGNCLQCSKPISKKRLKALPYTELCIECQKAKEVK